MINKIILLLFFKGGDPKLPFKPTAIPYNTAVEFLLEDSYTTLMTSLVKANLVKKVFIVAQHRKNAHLHAGYGIYKASEQIEIIYPPNLESAESYIGTINDKDIIWTRGTGEVWTDFLKRHMNARKVLYNLAVLNTDPNIYDLVFREEDCLFKELKKHPHSYTFIKPCNETVFFPMAQNKIYDIISIGSIRGRKGQLKIVRAGRRLKRPLKVIFPGLIKDKNYMEKCLQAAKNSELSLEFPGIVSRKKLNILINKSRFHVLASRRDQAPRVLLEVACAGVPTLITNRIGGGKNYITPKTGGICHEWRLAANMKKALDYWKKPVREGFLEKFSVHHAVEKVMAAFKDVDWI